MANSEIKVKITADNKQFLKAIDEVTGAVKKLNNLKTTDIDIVLSKADTVMRQIGEIGKALLGIADRTVRVTADASQALGEIGKVQEAMNRLPDKTVKVTADITQATSDISQIRGELDKIKATQDIEVRLAGNPSTLLGSLTDRLRNTELALNVNFSGATESARVFKNVLDSINRALRQFLSRINAIGNRRIRIRMDIRMPQIDTRWTRADLFRNAIASADVFIAKLRTINEMLARAVRLADRIRIPPSGGGSGGNGGGGGAEGGLFGGFLGGAAKVGAAIAGITYALGKVKDVAASVVMPGFNYAKEMETSQLGIAGILTSMTNLDGKAMDFASAMGISADIMQRLQMEAIKTSATTEELVTTFRGILAPGIGAGMTIEEIEKFTSVGVNALKGMGLNNTQYVQELRDLVQGGIQPASSTLATSLGITDADIKKAKASTEGLYNFLMTKLAGFKPMAEEFPKTLTGKLSMLGEFSTLASAKITEAFKPEIKAALDLVIGLIGSINKKTNEFEPNPKILEFVDMLKSGADNIIELFGQMNDKGQFEVNPETIDFFDGLGNGIRAVWDLLVSLGSTVDTLFNNSAFSIVKDYWIPILADLWSMAVDIVDMFTAAITVINNLADSVLNAVAPFDKFSSNAVKWAVEQLKEFVHMAKLGWDMLVKLSGGTPSKDNGGKRADWQKKSEEQEKKAAGGKGDITSKNAGKAAEEARIKAAKDALKEMVGFWKRELDRITRILNSQIETNKLRYDQNYIGIDEYNLTETQLKIQKVEAEINALKNELEATKNTPIDPKQESGQREKISDIEVKIEKKDDERNTLEKTLTDILKGAEKQNTISNVKRLPADTTSFLTPQSGDVDNFIYKYAQQFGVDPYLVKAMISQESGGDIKALSGAGAQGIMQLMPETAASMGVTDSYDLEQNIMGGVKYVAQQLQEFGGDIRLALAAYNAGPQAVKNAGNQVPDYSETQKYVPAIIGKWETLKAAAQTQPQSSPEGTTWVRENDRVDIEGLGAEALQAIGLMGDYFHQQTGRQMVVSSGMRNWGGHVSGKKFDIVDDMTSTLLEENIDGIRDKMMEYARKLNIARQGEESDEYAHPSTNATAGHLDFDATKFNKSGGMLSNITSDIGEMRSADSLAWKNQRKELNQKMLDIMQKFNEGVGNVSTTQIVQLELEYKEIIATMENNKLPNMAAMARKVLAGEKLKINFTQTQKDLEYANNELVDYQESLLNEMSKGSKDAAQATQAYISKFHTLTDDKLKDLQSQLDQAMMHGNKDLIIDLRRKIKEVMDSIGIGIEAILKRIDDMMDDEIARVNANRNMTSRQKDDAIEAIRRQGAADKVSSLKEELAGKIQEDTENGNNKNAEAIRIIEQQIHLNEEYAKTPSLLDDIHVASKQAFEDGLLDFLERGILECESLGEAFRNLANSVLQSIQKMYAEALMKNIMQALFPTQSSDPFTLSSGKKLDPNFGYDMNNPFANIPGFSEGGSTTEGDNGGLINGPGTGTSDSILGWIGNRLMKVSKGEFIFNADAVKRIGLNTLQRINSGDIYNLRIPVPKFARGGSVGNVGASMAAQGLDNFSANIGASFDPTINSNTTVRLDAASLLNGLLPVIKTQVEHRVDRNMIDKGKFYNQLGKRFK